MVRSTTAPSFGAEISTRSIFFTAWTAAALFGSDLHGRASDTNDDHDEPQRCTSPRWLGLERFRRATKQFALTEVQQFKIDEVVSQIHPLIVELKMELKEKQQALIMLQPGDIGFITRTGRLSNDIGTLATQLALTSSKLKTDVYAILSSKQQALLDELHTAFECME